jgi:hypothetical protein
MAAVFAVVDGFLMMCLREFGVRILVSKKDTVRCMSVQYKPPLKGIRM